MASTDSLIPNFEEADWITGTATVAIDGGQLVKISGDKQADGTYSFAPCGAGDANNVIGLAAFKAAVGQRITIALLDTFDGIVPLQASAAITAGDHVTTAANGQVVTTTTAGTKCVAIALATSYIPLNATQAIAECVLARHTI